MNGEASVGFKHTQVGESIKQQNNASKPEKHLGPACTSPWCAKTKSRHRDEFTDAQRHQIFDVFWKQMDRGQKKAYVTSLVDVHSLKPRNQNQGKPDTFIYYLKLGEKKVQVCRTMFLNTLAVGRRQVEGWMKSSLPGVPSTKKSCTTKNISDAKKNLLEFLDLLPKMPSHYCRSTTSKMYLEPDINSKMDLFRMYEEHCKANNVQ